MKIKTADLALFEAYELGQITMRQVRESFCLLGWFNYLPSEQQVKHIWINRGYIYE